MREKAVVAIVKGGLGNQLFIYAAARALALRSGRRLYLDIVRGYTTDDYGRSYRLDRFPIAASVMPEAWRVAPDLRDWRHRVTRALNKMLPLQWCSYLAERRDTTVATLGVVGSRRARVTMNGYWQNEVYFVDAAVQLRRELSVPAPSAGTLRKRGGVLAAEESVFLHVRRVRYSPVLDASYYQQAIDQACSALGNPVFVVFGDDLEWVRASLDFRGRLVEFQAYDGGDEFTDLWLMTKCRHAIIANSSFSWWAAWLGGDVSADRMVWAPVRTGLPLVNADGWQLIEAGLTEMSKRVVQDAG